VVLKLPQEAYPALVELLPTMGVVIARQLRSDDLSMQLEQQRTLLASRQSVLERYFAVLAEAGPESVVMVERQMTQLIQQIEALKATIQVLEHRVKLAELTVAFEFQERQLPARDGSSSFPWLNTVNLVDLVEEFTHGHQ